MSLFSPFTFFVFQILSASPFHLRRLPLAACNLIHRDLPGMVVLGGTRCMPDWSKCE